MFGLIVGAGAYGYVSYLLFEDYSVGMMAGLVASMVWGFLYARWFSKE